MYSSLVLCRHWTEIERHRSLLENITVTLSDEINEGTDKFSFISRELSDLNNMSDSLWLRFERINSTVGEFREDNEMLIYQVDNLTSIMEK